MTEKRAIGIIPARYEASRFPGKLLADLGGKTVIEHVYRRAGEAKLLDEILVATDDGRIREAVETFGGRVVMTSSNPRTGTERVEEACRDFSAEVVLNIQGDEPFLKGEAIDQVAGKLLENPELAVVTLMKKIDSQAEIEDPNVVKVVIDRDGFALYFSRSPIPHGPVRGAFKHLGLYGYRKEFLSILSKLPEGELEKRERLEQLRVLENGYKIKVLETEWDTVGIDTPEDLELARKIVAEKGES